jgi:hypothetical protein
MKQRMFQSLNIAFLSVVSSSFPHHLEAGRTPLIYTSSMTLRRFLPQNRCHGPGLYEIPFHIAADAERNS